MTERTDRQRRLVDMMLSMHSRLRDHYKRLSTLLDVAILVGSVVVCTLTFAEARILAYIGSPDQVRDVVGATGAILFALSLVGMRVEWKEKAIRHERSCEVLAELKSNLRSASEDNEELLNNGDRALARLTPIPDAKFPSLKAYHQRKIELSKLLDAYPSAPLWLLRLRLMRRDAGRAAAPKLSE